MVHIILLVLKIVGLVLLAVLGLILFLLLILLFVPIRYLAEGNHYGELKGRANISWFLHAVSLTVVYEGDLDVTVRIFGFRTGKKEKDREEDQKDGELGEEEFWDGISEALSQEEEVHMTSLDEEPEEDFVYAGKAQETRKEGEIPKAQETLKEDKILKKQRRPLFDRIRERFRALKKTWMTAGDKISKVRDFLSDPENKELFRLLFQQTKALLKHVLPGKIRGKWKIGFEDPYTTGQAMAIAGLLCPIYKNSVQVIPSFQEPAMEGELAMSGRIRLYNLVWILGKLFLNKKFRYLLKKVMN